MAELEAGKLPLAEKRSMPFSSQASFTRAFHRATGMTPRNIASSTLNQREPGLYTTQFRTRPRQCISAWQMVHET